MRMKREAVRKRGKENRRMRKQRKELGANLEKKRKAERKRGKRKPEDVLRGNKAG
jgi:hypothetical protein